MKKRSTVGFLSTVVFVMLSMQTAFGYVGFRSGDFGVNAYKNNIPIDSARVYSSKKNWTVRSFKCKNYTIHVSEPVVKAINRWRAKGYKISVFKVVKDNKQITLCWIK